MKRVNPLRPWAFANVYDKLLAVAQDNGYALALHGSMSRDLDLIAVPWTDNACDVKTLIEAMDEEASRWQLKPFRGIKTDLNQKNHKKPHGRVAYSIHFGSEAYIDISIMPRKVARKKVIK